MYFLFQGGNNIFSASYVVSDSFLARIINSCITKSCQICKDK